MKWFVYVVRCKDNSLYCGITTELVRRIKQHNGAIGGGAKCLRGRRPVKLAWSKQCESRSVALKMEAEFKRWPKFTKEAWLSAHETN